MEGQKKNSNFTEKIKKLWGMSESGVILITLVYAIFVQCMNPNFFSVLNMNSILRQTGYTLISGLGMTMVLIAGGIDLSVGSVMALSGIALGFVAIDFGMSFWIGILVALLCGALCGLFNGVIVVRFRIAPMIVTLGMMYIARGIVNVTTEGVSKYPLPDAFQALEQSTILGVPTVVWFCIILCIFFHFVLKRTTFGRAVYAIGGNKDTAKLAGINVSKITLQVYIISGIMAALMGVVMCSRLGGAQPSAGEGYEMNIIASCIIGGTSATGGRGTILGTAVGALFMSMLTNSMTLMKVSVHYQKLVVGLVLIIAVIVDEYRREIAQKRAVSSQS